ncbi:thiol-disulfide oxidoreductase DCC family protein [Amaricoccus tamworthensis]|uniref:thiol-disulfide oxidoreductase DCC family protein n=1 Tax=Amaricoccus tamworthensis TaxID=57002 RepID=UPI003C799F27
MVNPTEHPRAQSLEQPGAEPPDGPTVYYDGSCPLCSVEIDHYASRDGAEKLRFVDVSHSDADPGAGLNRTDAMARFHVRQPDGKLLSGARAFVAVWDTLPGWKWAARLAKIPGVTPVLELAYRAFLPFRPFLARTLGKRLKAAQARGGSASN